MVGFKGTNLGNLLQSTSINQTPNLLSSTMGPKGLDVLNLASGLGIGGTKGSNVSGLLSGLSGGGAMDPSSLLGGAAGLGGGGGANPFASVMGGLTGGAGMAGNADMWIPNPLSAIDQPAYHIRFFLAGDKLAQQIALTGNTSLLSSALLIAETGLTEFNITDLEIANLPGPSSGSRNFAAESLTIKIVEPLGASFLDRLFAGATQAGVSNYYKAFYFIQIRFHGYDPTTGQYADQIGGKVWTYATKLTDCVIDVNAGGSKYTLTMVQSGDFPAFSHYGMVKLSFAPSASTVGEFFQKLKETLELEQKPLYGYTRHTYNFVIHELPTQYDILSSVTTSPSTWALQNPDFTEQHSRETSTQAISGETETGVENSVSMKDIVSKVFGSTLEGQQLIARSQDPTKPSNQAYNAVAWKVQADFQLSQSLIYDVIHDDYNYDITFHLIPFVTTDILMSVEQREDSTNQQLIEQKIQKLQSQGRLRKQYQYLFTGLNTEVIDFDINQNLFWFGWVPNTMQSQGDSSQSTPEMMGDYQIDNQTMPDLKARVDPLIAQIQQLTAIGDITKLNEISGQIQSLMQQAFAQSGRGTASPQFSAGGAGGYVETIDTSSGYGTPISYDKAVTASDQSFMGQVEHDTTSGAAVYAMAINQLFGLNAALMDLDITIRGDPYWLGYTLLDIGQQPGNGAISAASEGKYPDFHMMDNCIMVQFVFPQGVDEATGEPILKPVNLFTGIYIVNTVVHKFSGGKFTQQLKGFRNNSLGKEFAPPSAPMTGAGGLVPSGLGMSPTIPSFDPASILNGGNGLSLPGLGGIGGTGIR